MTRIDLGTKESLFGDKTPETTAEPAAPLGAQKSARHLTMDVLRTPSASRKGRRYVVFALGGAVALGGIMWALKRLKPAAPAVERGAIWMDTVRRGPMVREVLGQGILTPESIRWITANTECRVEKVLVRPGAAVKAETVLIELSNSDLQLQALEAERQLAQATAELANLQASLNSQKLAQQSVVASLASEGSDARRRLQADAALANKGFLSDLELSQTEGHANELAGRLDFEKKRLVAQTRGIVAQMTAQKAQVERLRSIAEFRRNEVADLKKRAGVDGVLQELSLQPGQSVAKGAVLAKVARPDRLKAEIRVSEVQARDVQLGQKVSINTRTGIIAGHVSRIDPAVQGGRVLVDVALEGDLRAAGARPDLNVEGTIVIERLASVLHVGRPVASQAGLVTLFKVSSDGSEAERTTVKLGRSSVKTVEVVSGLAEGDRVVLSDVSQFDQTDRIRLR